MPLSSVITGAIIGDGDRKRALILRAMYRIDHFDKKRKVLLEEAITTDCFIYESHSPS